MKEYSPRFILDAKLKYPDLPEEEAILKRVEDMSKQAKGNKGNPNSWLKNPENAKRFSRLGVEARLKKKG